ncbi:MULTISPECIES: peptide deformylase [Methylococcus]|uniref:Peptide deformylase n=1 Tax=Methylococcus capsulatus TaxID=414 RepID=A0ABZ2F6H5_METCP|nr:peptide deformylase [Methylococcus capsulatus]MDF9392463.1 peptide deformylase [Methylococcus capsulatus]
MTILSILEFPDERLRKKAAPVEVFDDDLRRTVDDMFETMYAAPGVGLAATQVNLHKRILVIDVSEEKNAPLCLINPELLEKQGNGEMEEGCLSVPGIFEKVCRAESVRIRAQDRNGEFFEMSAEGLLAVCIQHEMDHLEGKLFLDHLSALKRQMARKKLQKERRMKAINKTPRAAAAV